MGRELPITAEYDSGLYDSANGRKLVTEKVVDITDDCRIDDRTILLFTRAARGRIVQIAHPYDGYPYMGSHIHFFFDEPLGGCDDGLGDTFTVEAKRVGFSAGAFAALIKELAPPPTGDG